MHRQFKCTGSSNATNVKCSKLLQTCQQFKCTCSSNVPQKQFKCNKMQTTPCVLHFRLHIFFYDIYANSHLFGVNIAFFVPVQTNESSNINIKLTNGTGFIKPSVASRRAATNQLCSEQQLLDKLTLAVFRCNHVCMYRVLCAAHAIYTVRYRLPLRAVVQRALRSLIVSGMNL